MPRAPRASPRSCRHFERKLQTAVAELLEQHMTQSGIARALPIRDVALAAIALDNGLALEELSNPGRAAR